MPLPLYDRFVLLTPLSYRSDLLKDEFLSVPVRHITNVLKQHKTLFKAYGILEEHLRNYEGIATPFSKIAKSRTKRGIELILIERGSQLPKELHAAKKKSETQAGKYHLLVLVRWTHHANARAPQIPISLTPNARPLQPGGMLTTASSTPQGRRG